MSQGDEGKVRGLARWLVRAARQALPASDREWADAMDAELFAIVDDYEALRWAIGCLAASELTQLRPMLRRPGACVPLIMSMIALTMVVVHAALFGIVKEADEGTPAHVFQLLMVAQIPFIAVLIARWLPDLPGPTLRILALQLGAALCAVLAVLLLT